jgi:hypothetical protein
MDRRLKTASHLERMIMIEMRRHAICDGVSAVTVSELPDGKSWEVTDIHAPGGAVSPACREICLGVAARLAEQYDILPERDLAPDDDLRLGGV